MPVEAGEADQGVLDRSSQQQAVVAGRDEAGEEATVALLVDLLDAVEALVGGEQRQRLLELLRGHRFDPGRSLHRGQASTPGRAYQAMPRPGEGRTAQAE